MRYSIKPMDRIYVKGYGFLSFAKNMSNKYSEKVIDTSTAYTTDTLKTAKKKSNSKKQKKQLVI